LSTESEKLRGIRLESEDLVNKLQVAAGATTEIPHFEGEERLTSERLWAYKLHQYADDLQGNDEYFKFEIHLAPLFDEIVVKSVEKCL
jgi:hypothetical protein